MSYNQGEIIMFIIYYKDDLNNIIKLKTYINKNLKLKRKGRRRGKVSTL